ncbi:MAG: hypothetical protein H6606_09575 [Flavobacteriales bacterium]|nr:hypothetical protein [Flavobacteriales bacterium]
MSRIRLILFSTAIAFLLLPNCSPTDPGEGTDPMDEICDQIQKKLGEDGMRAILENCIYTDSLSEFITLAQRSSDDKAVVFFNDDPGIVYYWAARIGVGIEYDTLFAYFDNQQEGLLAMGFQPHQIRPAEICEPLNSIYQPLFVEGAHSEKMHEAVVMVTKDGKPKRRGTLVTQTPLGNTALIDPPDPTHSDIEVDPGSGDH